MTAFLNSNGGTVLVGVNDGGEIMGIEQDGFSSQDTYYLHFTNLVKSSIGHEYLSYINSEIVPVEEGHVLKIDCMKSGREVFLRSGDEEEFYIRSGPSTIKLEGSKLLNYVNQRFKHE